MGIKFAHDLPSEVNDINGMLDKLNMRRLHRTTLHGIKTISESKRKNRENTEPAPCGSDELLETLLAVGPCIGKQDWAHTNLYKLNIIGVHNKETLRKRIWLINSEIAEIGLPKFRTTTLEALRSELTKAEGMGINNDTAYSKAEAFVFAACEGMINRNWLLLDSQASLNLVANPKLLTNIRKHPQELTITVYCNAGSVKVNQVGNLNGFGTVWYNPGGLVNVLSLGLVSDRHRVTLDTSIAQTFIVHKPDGTTRGFKRVENNLYICDLSKQNEAVFAAITTVDGQKKLYSELDFQRAERARKLQEALMFPSDAALKHMVENNLLRNCPVSSRDINIAKDIWKANSNIVKGKAVRRQPGHVREGVSPVPADILAKYGQVAIGIDIITVNSIKFFRSISRHICFRTNRVILDATKETIVECLKSIFALYTGRGFVITQVFGDNEFACAEHTLQQLGIAFHSIPPNGHEPFIERDNRTIKERVRCAFASLPFDVIPPRMTIELVNAANFWLNCWCSKSGVSTTLSPRELMTGTRMDYNKHARFQFGEYVLAHNEDGDNTMTPRAIDAIYLRPTGNLNGGHFVFNLKTARRVHRKRLTAVNMTDSIINKVEAIARAQNGARGIMFGDREGLTTIHDLHPTDTDSDEDYTPDDASVDSHLTGVTTETSPVTDSDGDDSDENDSNGEPHEEDIYNPMPRAPPDTTHPDPIDHEPASATDTDVITTPAATAPSDGDDAGTNDTETNDTESDPTEGGPPNSNEGSDPTTEPLEQNEGSLRRSLRSSVQRTHPKFYGLEGANTHTVHRVNFNAGYGNAARQIEQEHIGYCNVAAAIDQYNNIQASQVTPQYGVKRGLKEFGEAGVEAVMKELKQLDEREVISPCHRSEMTEEEIKRALPYLMFLKRKRCGKIKGRGCADGRGQRDYISKEEASSPTVSLYAMMLGCTIDAIEERDVATADIPGAFLQTEMPKDEPPVHIRVDGAMAELLAKLDPMKYGPCIIDHKRGKTLYAKANKAIYGTLRAALLFYQKLTDKLKEWGFIVNPYDICTMNKIINGSQATIMFHVDDLKISHIDPNIVTEIVNKLDGEFGQITPLTVTRGKIHDYVGMTIDFSDSNRVRFTMIDFLQDIIANLPDGLKENRVFVTPAADHLFNTNADAKKLPIKQAEVFHSYVAKLLFAAKRARPDIQTAVAFLCTRVQMPDEDDWKKLKRVLSYIKGTVYLPLVLGADNSGNIYWHVDASFAVHPDMRSHTGAVMTLGQGAVIGISTKQKINTKSSTEAELVGVDDTMALNLWCYYFLQWQGHHAIGSDDPSSKDNEPSAVKLGHTNVLFQDNMSSIKLEQNGRASSSKRTRHINIRYFAITDRVRSGEVTIQYRPTLDMIGDYYTKPLQGNLFRKFRNLIMGVTESDCIQYRREFEKAVSTHKDRVL